MYKPKYFEMNNWWVFTLILEHAPWGNDQAPCLAGLDQSSNHAYSFAKINDYFQLVEPSRLRKWSLMWQSQQWWDVFENFQSLLVRRLRSKRYAVTIPKLLSGDRWDLFELKCGFTTIFINFCVEDIWQLRFGKIIILSIYCILFFFQPILVSISILEGWFLRGSITTVLETLFSVCICPTRNIFDSKKCQFRFEYETVWDIFHEWVSYLFWCNFNLYRVIVT